jgi:hypothetical protein
VLLDCSACPFPRLCCLRQSGQPGRKAQQKEVEFPVPCPQIFENIRIVLAQLVLHVETFAGPSADVMNCLESFPAGREDLTSIKFLPIRTSQARSPTKFLTRGNRLASTVGAGSGAWDHLQMSSSLPDCLIHDTPSERHEIGGPFFDTTNSDSNSI